MDYSFAVADDNTVRKYLKKPGVLQVYFHDCDSETFGLDEYSVCFAAEIYNDRGGKMKLLRKLVLEMGHTSTDTRYWLPDGAGTGLTPLFIN